MQVLTKREKCRLMRAAKERKRMAASHAPEARVTGTATFDGPDFGGRHIVRIIALSDRPLRDVEVDGRVTCAKTPRGVRALLMRRISGAATCNL